MAVTLIVFFSFFACISIAEINKYEESQLHGKPLTSSVRFNTSYELLKGRNLNKTFLSKYEKGIFQNVTPDRSQPFHYRDKNESEINQFYNNYQLPQKSNHSFDSDDLSKKTEHNKVNSVKNSLKHIIKRKVRVRRSETTDATSGTSEYTTGVATNASSSSSTSESAPIEKLTTVIPLSTSNDSLSNMSETVTEVPLPATKVVELSDSQKSLTSNAPQTTNHGIPEETVLNKSITTETVAIAQRVTTTLGSNTTASNTSTVTEGSSSSTNSAIGLEISTMSQYTPETESLTSTQPVFSVSTYATNTQRSMASAGPTATLTEKMSQPELSTVNQSLSITDPTASTFFEVSERPSDIDRTNETALRPLPTTDDQDEAFDDVIDLLNELLPDYEEWLEEIVQETQEILDSLFLVFGKENSKLSDLENINQDLLPNKLVEVISRYDLNALQSALVSLSNYLAQLDSEIPKDIIALLKTLLSI